MPRKQTFKKINRLSRQTDIQELFNSSSSFYIHPFKVLMSPGDGGVKVLISVPKKLFPRAVDRNRIKRQIREAYRKNRIDDSEAKEFNFNIAYIYLAKEPLEFKVIENKLIQCNDRLMRQGEESSRNGKKS